MNNKYTLSHSIHIISEKLHAVYQDKQLCNQYAIWILQAICNTSMAELLAQKTLMLSPEQQQTIDEWLHKLIDEKMPLQYLLGSVPFANLDILVEPPILIPRPETEEWSLKVIEQMKLLDNKKVLILDLATGSGCIALALASQLPQAAVVATDIAEKALELAEKNREHNALHNVTFIQSDLFEALPQDIQFDLIVCNPPYISFEEFKTLDETVTKWEDYGALVADDNGLAIIKKIIAQAPQFIQTNNEMKQKKIPQLVIEIGYDQGAAVQKIMKESGYNNILIHKDLEQKDRFVTGRIDTWHSFHSSKMS